MKTNRLISLLAGLSALIASFNSSANYIYTFTSQPFQYIYSTIPDGPLSSINNEDFLKFSIITDEVLQANRQYSAFDILQTGTIEASLGNVNSTFSLTDYYKPSNDLVFDLYSFDDHGLPSSWNIQLLEDDKQYGSEHISSINWYSRNTVTQETVSQIQVFASIEPYRYLYSESYGGEWQVPQNPSPVPEAPEYAMLLAGLGLLGLIRRNFTLTNSKHV